MLHGLYSYALRRFVGHYSLPVDKFSADKEGIPVFLKQFLRKDDKKGYCIGHIQSMLTLLDIHSLLGPCTTVPNSDGITRPGVISKSRYTESEVFNGRFFMELYDKTKDNKFLYYSQVWSDLLEKEFPKEEQEKRVDELKQYNCLHLSYKAGPNGPSFLSSIFDFYQIYNRKTSKHMTVLGNVKSLSERLGNYELNNIIKFFDYVSSYEGNLIDFRNIKKSYIPKDCKFSIKFENRGKSRLIAILDFFTQSVLKGIHDHHFSWLKNQTEDGTHDQYRVKRLCSSWTNGVFNHIDSPHSLDLTEATNRAPAVLQLEIIRQMYGDQIAKDWYDLCTNRKFLSPDGKRLEYSVGQPMGTYTSWSTFTIMNHMLVRMSSIIENIDYINYNQYLIIGDDVVTKSTTLSDRYTSILKDIGVDVSPTKGYTYTTNLSFIKNGEVDTNVAEIAKSVFLNGVEITPLRPQALNLMFKDPSSFMTACREIQDKQLDIGFKEYEDLIQLCWKPKQTSRLFLSPYNSLDFIREFYDFISSNTEIIRLKEVFEIENYKTIYSQFSNLTYVKSDYEKNLLNNLKNSFYKKFNNCVKELDKLLYNNYHVLGEDLIYSPNNSKFLYKNLLKISTKIGYTLTPLGEECLKYLLLYVFKYSYKSFKESLTNINNSNNKPSIEQYEDLLISLMSIKELNMLLKSKTILERKVLESQLIKDTFSQQLKYDKIDIYSGKDRKPVIHNKYTGKVSSLSDFSDKLDSYKYIGEEKSIYLQSEVGFESTLSDSTRIALSAIKEKFKFRSDTNLSLTKLKNFSLNERDQSEFEYSNIRNLVKDLLDIYGYSDFYRIPLSEIIEQ